MKPPENVNRCRPGYGASCALCCGSHNYASGPEKTDAVFRRRGRIFRESLPLIEQGILSPKELKHELGTPVEKLKYPDAMQCPYTGYLEENDSVISCLAYAHPAVLEPEYCRFFTGTCKNYYCNAWHLLTDEEVLFAASLTRDWYCYSLFISDIPFLKKTFSNLGPEYEVQPGRAGEIIRELLTRNCINV